MQIKLLFFIPVSFVGEVRWPRVVVREINDADYFFAKFPGFSVFFLVAKSKENRPPTSPSFSPFAN